MIHSCRKQPPGCLLLCIAIALCLLAPCPARSAEATATLTQIAGFEEKLFGKTEVQEKSVEKRLDRIETRVFGAPQRGSVSKRVKAIHDLIGASQASELEPPVAPVIDHGCPPTAAPMADKPMRGYVVEHHEEINSLLSKGVSAYARGDLDEAQRLFEQVVTADRHNSDAFFNLGAIAERRGDFNGALRDYRIALSLIPSDAEYGRAVGSMEHKLGIKNDAYLRTPMPPPTINVAQTPPPQSTVQTNPIRQGEAQPQGRRRGLMRAVVGGGLGIGFGFALRESGLHCPACRVLRFGL